MENELKLGWQRYVTPGHVWVARLNTLTWIGAVALFALSASAAWDVYDNTLGLAKRLSAAQSAPPTWWERFKVSPIETIKGTINGGFSGAQPRPAIDQNVVLTIQPVSTTTQIKLDALTKPADLKSYIEDNVAALNSTGKLSTAYPACEPLVDLRTPWVARSGQPDIPKCLISKSGDTIWMASLISDGNQFSPRLMSWIGVFHKAEKSWEYRNAEGLGGSAKLPGYKSVNADMVPYQVAADFPYLVASTEGVEK